MIQYPSVDNLIDTKKVNACGFFDMLYGLCDNMILFEIHVM